MTKGIRIIAVLVVVFVVFICCFFALRDKLPDIKEKIGFERKYIIKFEEEVKKASLEFGVPEEIIYAIIRTESNFKADAVSSAGAKGLMQLMPDTFSWVAMRLGEKEEPEKIFDPYVNIRYGTYYLSFLMERFEKEESVFAAYNAGHNRVKGWLSDTRYSDDGISLKKIPIEETKRYVKKVVKAKTEYIKMISETEESESMTKKDESKREKSNID